VEVEEMEDIILEDIIDDIGIDAIELHDSDDSGADLQQEGLDLDDLEEDAIPDDPLKQDNSVINFEFVGMSPTNSRLSLSPNMKSKPSKYMEDLLISPTNSSNLKNQPYQPSQFKLQLNQDEVAPEDNLNEDALDDGEALDLDDGEEEPPMPTEIKDH
jgi:hypothetical protein